MMDYHRPVTQTRRPATAAAPAAVARAPPPIGPSLDDFPAPGRSQPANQHEQLSQSQPAQTSEQSTTPHQPRQKQHYNSTPSTNNHYQHQPQLRPSPARTRAKVGADTSSAVYRELPERPQHSQRAGAEREHPARLQRFETKDLPLPKKADRQERYNLPERPDRLEPLEQGDHYERLQHSDRQGRNERIEQSTRPPTAPPAYPEHYSPPLGSPPTEKMNGSSRYADSVSGAPQRTYTYNRQRPAERAPDHGYTRPIRSSRMGSSGDELAELSPPPQHLPFWSPNGSVHGGDSRSVLSRSSSRTAGGDAKTEGQRVAQVLSRRIQALEAELKQKKETVVSISSAVDKIQKEHSTEIHKMSRQHAKEVADLEARLFALKSGAAVAPRRGALGQSPLLDEQDGLESILAEEVAERDEIISQREKTISELRDAERMAWEQVEEQAQSLAEKDQEYGKKLDDQRRNLTRSAERLQKELVSRDEQMQQLHQELVQARSENSQLRVEVESLAKGLEVAKVTAAKSEARRESLEDSNQSLQSQVRQSEMELKRLRSSENLPRVGSADTLRPQTAVPSPSAVQEREVYLQKQINAQIEEIRSLKSDMRNTRVESSQMEAKVANLTTSKAEVERQLQFKTLEADMLYKQLMTSLKHDDSHALLGQRDSSLASEAGVIEPRSPKSSSSSRQTDESRDSWDMPGNAIGVQPVHGNAFQQAAQYASTSSF